MKTTSILLLTSAGLFLCGCRQAIIDRTDRAVYQVIEQRQLSAVGFTADARVEPGTGDMGQAGNMYRFVPHPLTPDLPEAFRTQIDVPTAADDTLPQPGHTDITSPTQAEEESPESEIELSLEVFSEEELDRIEALGLRLGLRKTLAYAMAHARELQDAKEDLYLAALDLTLERHLWTPQFVASVQGEFADYGQVRKFDRAMSTVSDVTVIQSLPYGGEVTARVLASLMRDLGSHVTSGESGTAIIEAAIPLFRGAGLVAYESRIQAERELVYAVRDYERFRRSFLVDVAGDYFNLQQSKAQITNTYQAYLSRKAAWEKEDLKSRLGQSDDVFDAFRVKANMRDAESSLVNAKTRYETALDRFKIAIGMPVEHLLDVVDQEDDAESKALERLLPNVSLADATDVAVTYRLDLLNDTDRVDDARRNVRVAKNRMLPDLDLSGSVTMSTDPNRKNSLSYNTERSTWRGFINLRMDDRKTERNAYRRALIEVRRAQRRYEESADVVRADVRSANRDLKRESKLLVIEGFNVEENEFRAAAAIAKEKLGKIRNQDFVDAQDDLLRSQNDMASAVAGYRRAILRYRLATGTLRIAEDGWWGENLGSTDAGVESLGRVRQP